MDLDAVLARKPEVAVVDELAHTNAPGGKNEKRWQDVEDLLAAGISVLTAVNVQHLEGVQDVVKSATGLEVSERVPDRVIREADAVVNVDLPVSELRDRLKQGKIYPPAQAASALENFFREENLQLPARARAPRDGGRTSTRTGPRRRGPFAARLAGIRVAVALPLDTARARALIRRGSKLAGRMNTRWYALYVRRKRDQPENLSAAQHRELTENIKLAMSLGANVVYRESEDVAGGDPRLREGRRGESPRDGPAGPDGPQRTALAGHRPAGPRGGRRHRRRGRRHRCRRPVTPLIPLHPCHAARGAPDFSLNRGKESHDGDSDQEDPALAPRGA